MVLTKTKLLRELKAFNIVVDSRYFKPSATELEVFEKLLDELNSYEVVDSSRVSLQKVYGDKVILKPFKG